MSRFARRIRPSVQSELDAARQADAGGDAGASFGHLERAHVLGQAATREHVRVHWAMFRWALQHRDAAEAVGQVWRLVAATLLTWPGWVPQGNTGGSKVSGVRRMPVPPDLQRLITAASLDEPVRVGVAASGAAIGRPGPVRARELAEGSTHSSGSRLDHGSTAPSAGPLGGP